jgi:glycosyltransferase involved in cell wall biosynthesis/GT2 family glycosyltransferase
MKLFTTSLYSNFGAERFDFTPDSLRWEVALEPEQTRLLKQSLSSDVDEVWLFGIEKFETDKQVAQRKFVFPSPQQIQNDSVVPCIADSWAVVPDFLFSLAQNKKIFFCIHLTFLANLSDPRPLLLAYKKMALNGVSCQATFILDQSHSRDLTREWTLASLVTFLTSAGLEIASHQDLGGGISHLEITTCSDQYRNYLTKIGLNHSALDCRQLFISTEDSSLEPSGGIGTYIENIKRLSKNSLFLYCDQKKILQPEGEATLLFSDLLGHHFTDASTYSMDMVEAVKVILFALPNIRICEIQDYMSLGFRIVQAKHTGQLPSSLFIRTLLHGSIDHIKYAEGVPAAGVYSIPEIKTAIRDSFVYKYSDECRSPSQYLIDLMSKEFGYALNNPVVVRSPLYIGHTEVSQHENIKDICRIVFIGKYSYQKGWQDFIKIIETLQVSNKLTSILEIVALAPGAPTKHDAIKLATACVFSYRHLSREDLLTYVAANKEDSLFVLPSRGENYPYAILELIAAGAKFVTYGSGGISEMIEDKGQRALCLADNAQSLYQLIETYIERTNAEDKAAVQNKIDLAQCRMLAQQKLINISFEMTSDIVCDVAAAPSCQALVADVTITTPVFNTKISYLQDLLNSITCSSIRPVEWLLVNDGSSFQYSHDLYKFILLNQDRIKIRLVSQDNKGLSAARNLGLLEAKTKYALFIDSDDLVLPHTLAQGLAAHRASPELVAVAGLSMYFDGEKPMPQTIEPIRHGAYWSPLGIPEAKSLSLLENQCIPSCTFVNVEQLRRAGGWDESDRSTWEDWALCLHLAWNNFRFSLIPSPGFLYRNTPGSMSKTYNQYLGRRRLIRNVGNLSRLDANVLSTMAMAADPRSEDGDHRLQALLDSMRNSRSWRVTAPLRWGTDRVRALKLLVKKLFISFGG